MAISRRLILKLGVSYGTGTINFGNDSVAYDRALRDLPASTVFQEFIDALASVEEVEEPEELFAGAPDAVPDSVTASEEVMPQTGDGSEVHPAGDSPASSEPACEGEESAVGNAAEAAEENPLADVIAKAKQFQQLCAQLALSNLYLKTKAIVAALQEDQLPSADEVANLTEAYNALMDYLRTC